MQPVKPQVAYTGSPRHDKTSGPPSPVLCDRESSAAPVESSSGSTTQDDAPADHLNQNHPTKSSITDQIIKAHVGTCPQDLNDLEAKLQSLDFDGLRKLIVNLYCAGRRAEEKMQMYISIPTPSQTAPPPDGHDYEHRSVSQAAASVSTSSAGLGFAAVRGLKQLHDGEEHQLHQSSYVSSATQTPADQPLDLPAKQPAAVPNFDPPEEKKTFIRKTSVVRIQTPSPPGHGDDEGEITRLFEIAAPASRAASATDLRASECGSPFDSAASLRHLHRHDFQASTAHNDLDFAGYETVNGYTFIEHLGSGTNGQVWQVMDDDGETFAMKILRKPRKLLMNASRTPSPDNLKPFPHSPPPELTPAFQREAAIMKKLQHRHIVPLYEVIEDNENDRWLLRMKYISKGPLLEFNKHTGRTDREVSETIVRKYLRQIASGLAYLHHRNIVHRDLKPQNLLVDHNDDVYLADFGVSVALTGSFRVSPHEGTPAFYSPEIVSAQPGESVDGKATDIWALGVTMFSLVAGYHPFAAGGCSIEETKLRILRDEICFPPNVQVSEACVDCIMKMLEKDPLKRITVDELRQHPFLGRRTKLRAEQAVRAAFAEDENTTPEREGVNHLRSLLLSPSAHRREMLDDDSQEHLLSPTETDLRKAISAVQLFEMRTAGSGFCGHPRSRRQSTRRTSLHVVNPEALQNNNEGDEANEGGFNTAPEGSKPTSPSSVVSRKEAFTVEAAN